MTLKTRVARLEVERVDRNYCALCSLVAEAAGASDTEAAELARHPRHGLEELVRASMRPFADSGAPAAGWRH